MKKLKKLTNGFIYLAIEIVVLSLILLAVAIGAGLHNSLDYLIGVLMIYIIFALVVWAIVLVYGIVMFSSYKKAKDVLLQIPGFREDRFEREIEKAPKVKHVVISSDAICFRAGGGMVKAVPIQDIVWAYEDNHRNGEFLHIWTKDKREYYVEIVIKKKFGVRDAACRYLLRLIARKNKGTLIGYEEEYDQMVKKNFEQILARTQGKEIVSGAALEQEYIQNDYYTKDFC